MNRHDYRWTVIALVLLVIAVMVHIDIWHIDQTKFDADPDKYNPVMMMLLALYVSAMASACRIGR